MSDIFGVNGRRVLDGLVAERSPRCILTGLTGHVQAKLAPLAQALAATLDPLALFTLQMQVEAIDRADAALAALDRRIQTALADCQRPLRLLQTIPGIDLGSASRITNIRLYPAASVCIVPVCPSSLSPTVRLSPRVIIEWFVEPGSWESAP